MKLLYDNIAISGGVAVGTTTLLDNLKPYLTPLQFRFKSMGQFVREYTKENIRPLATLVSDEFDRNIEKKVRETFERETQWVVEAWLAGFMARDLPRTLKILLICSSEAVRIDRVVNRDKIDIASAKKSIKEREETNLTKWRRLYGDFNFFDPTYYDIVIDTYSSGQTETVESVLNKMGFKK